MTKKVYEILWKYTNSKGKINTLKICEYLEHYFPFLYRDQVVSTDRKKLYRTIDYLNIMKSFDEEFIIVEKKYEI